MTLKTFICLTCNDTYAIEERSDTGECPSCTVFTDYEKTMIRALYSINETLDGVRISLDSVVDLLERRQA